jgi:hypothetical protein
MGNAEKYFPKAYNIGDAKKPFSQVATQERRASLRKWVQMSIYILTMIWTLELTDTPGWCAGNIGPAFFSVFYLEINGLN